MRTLGKNSSHSLSHTESNLLSLRTALLAVHTKRVSTTPKGNPAQNAPIGLAATGGPRTEFNRRPEQADVRSSLSTGRNFSGNRTNQALWAKRDKVPVGLWYHTRRW